MKPITFKVEGRIAAQGSKKSVGHGVFVETSKYLKPWRKAVIAAAQEANVDGIQFDGPIRVDIEFRFPMPQSRKKAEKEAGVLMKVSSPDYDKLERAVNDALTQSGLIKDDARICEGHSYKREYWEDWTGAIITVSQATLDEIDHP